MPIRPCTWSSTASIRRAARSRLSSRMCPSMRRTSVQVGVQKTRGNYWKVFPGGEGNFPRPGPEHSLLFKHHFTFKKSFKYLHIPLNRFSFFLSFISLLWFLLLPLLVQLLFYLTSFVYAGATLQLHFAGSSPGIPSLRPTSWLAKVVTQRFLIHALLFNFDANFL